MKQLLCLICLIMAGCQVEQDRFLREASAFPEGYVGRWETVVPSRGTQVFQAGVSIETSGDSLVWAYFSQLVDTTNNRKIACGPAMDLMPIWWDDSLQLAQANHGVGQGYGFDFLQLTSANQLQMNSPSLAPDCRGFFGLNATQLVFTKVDSFRFEP